VAELLVDTDVFVDHLRGARRLAPGRDSVSYSVITRCELFAGDAEQEGAVEMLLAPFAELGVDRRVAEVAGRLRRETGVRTPDALIAATALIHRLTLLTRNRRDFDRVPRLNIREPR
jgi:predicted nucleic acid-binding protein